ncbi:oligosaccharide flippase family protein, partial [Alphaproteobacteria bacterium]|nr:oligosaccharide flippase family protein [Alphaproteobacteria bacterium]
KFISSAILLKFFGGILAYASIQIIAILMFNDTFLSYLLLIVGSVIFFQLLDLLQSLYYVDHEGKSLANYRLYSYLVISIVRVFLLVFECPFYLYIIPFIIEPLLLGSILYFGIRKKKIQISLKFVNFKIIKRYFIKGLPLALSVLLVSINLRLDQLIIVKFLTFEDVGIYSIAVRIIETWFVIPTVVCTTVLALFAKTKVVDPNQYYENLSILTALLTIISIVFVLITLATAEILVPVIFGEQYVEAPRIINILIISVVTITHSSLFAMWQIIENKQKYRLYCQLAGLSVNASISLTLVSYFGSAGVAIGSVCGFFTSTYLLPLYFTETRSFVLLIVASSFNFKKFSQGLKDRKRLFQKHANIAE